MQCPGQDSRYWSGEDVFETECPQCGHVIEFFKDDSQRRCGRCGGRVLNPKMDFGCASYCPHADQCLGSMPPELLAKRDDLFKDRVTIAVRKYFGAAAAKIDHAQKAAEYAEKIGRDEKGDMAVIVAGTLLFGIETPEEGRKLLADLKADSVVIERVVDLLNYHHHPVGNAPDDFAAVHDADKIAGFLEQFQKSPPSDEQVESAAGSMLTISGRELAGRVLRKKLA